MKKEILIDIEDFKEEESKLNSLVNAIKEILANPQKYLPYPEVKMYDTASDYDEAADLHYKKRENHRTYETYIAPWNERIDSPYYGRFDVNVDGEYHSIYIGEEDLYENGKHVVQSGNSPIGMFYTQTTMKNGNFGSTKYEALLRRRLLIENSELILAEDAFIAGIDPKYNGITDPYLLMILKNNRKKTNMTSILSSIQEKQFNIVCQPREDSFIVQGCAGSGKTAILFQRLSNIQYNNPGFVNEKVRIISPNPGFIEFVGPLAKQLKLNHLSPITMDDYYKEVLKRYNVEARNNTLSDDNLNSHFIEEIYDEKFFYTIAKKGSNYIESFLQQINFTEFNDILKNKGFERRLENKFNLNELSSYLETAKSFSENIISDYNDIKSQLNSSLETYNKICDKNSIKCEFNIKNLNEIKDLIKKQIFNLVKDINNYISSNSFQTVEKIWLSNPPTEFEVLNLDNQVKKLIQEFKEKQLSDNEKLNELKQKLNNLVNFDKNKWEKETLPSLVNEKAEIEESLKTLTFLAIFRKQMLRNRINEINKTIADQTASLNLYESTKANLEKQITELESKNKNYIEPEELNNFSKHANEIYQEYQSVIFLIENYSIYFNVDKLVEIYNELKKIINNNPFEYNKLYKQAVLPELHEIYKKFGFKFSVLSDSIDGKHYTFNNYVRLSIASMFLSKPYNRDKLICIDEGQEYSKNEFMLLSDVNSSEEEMTILNIYGDLNQRNSSKGIKDWKVFVPELCKNIFSLNENYRNSAEIVKYTNNKLNLNDIAIGLNEGHEVKDISLKEALALINENNLCIIIKENSNLYNKLVLENLRFNIKERGIILLTPLLAKGQEFEKVLVFDNDMDNIEKYVSYTRAKSKLFVCSEKI